MKQLTCSAIALFLTPLTPVAAQGPAVSDLQAKIFDAHMAQKTFVNGLRFCNELDGKNFFHQARNRVLNLEDYRRSLESLTAAEAYNPAKRRPWNVQDANESWEQAKAEARRDKEICELVASLPTLEKELEELKRSEAPQQKN